MIIQSNLYLSLLIAVHLYLIVRYAVQGVFRQMNYRFLDMLTVALIPLLGYYFVYQKNKREEEEAEL